MKCYFMHRTEHRLGDSSWITQLIVTYELYQLKVSQLRPSSWYSLSALPFLYSLELSSFFQSAAEGRSLTQVEMIRGR